MKRYICTTYILIATIYSLCNVCVRYIYKGKGDMEKNVLHLKNTLIVLNSVLNVI